MVLVFFLLLEKAQIAANAKELLKEGLQLVDNPLLFLFATTAKAAHRWHKLVDIRASGLDFPIAEGIIQEFTSFFGLELFVLDYLLQILLPLDKDKVIPLAHNIIAAVIIDAFNEALNELLLTAQRGTGIYSLVDGY